MNPRHQKILDRLHQQGEVTVQELAEAFGVTPMTIRRDLDFLAEQNRLTRTHGGAMRSTPAVIEFAFLERNRERIAEKQAIARAAAALVEPGMTLVLDTGTTTLEVARAIAGVPDLTVLTSSLAIASALYGRENIALILLGGNVRRNSPDLSGPLTEANLRCFRPHLAILGADALDSDGLYTSDQAIAAVSRAMIASAEETILVADSDKFTRRAFVHFACWLEITHLVTDNSVGEDARRWLAAAGVDVRYV
jgi:DeoR/GlpR family transcriptional regulator of sugar metabolism